MKIVVQMLEGNGDMLAMPPNPFASVGRHESSKKPARAINKELEVISELLRIVPHAICCESPCPSEDGLSWPDRVEISRARIIKVQQIKDATLPQNEAGDGVTAQTHTATPTQPCSATSPTPFTIRRRVFCAKDDNNRRIRSILKTQRGQKVEITERTLEGASTPSKDLISFVCAYRRGVVFSALRTTTTEGSDPSWLNLRWRVSIGLRARAWRLDFCTSSTRGFSLSKGYLRMTYLENQVAEPLPTRRRRGQEPRSLLDPLFWAWTDRGVKLRHYAGDPPTVQFAASHMARGYIPSEGRKIISKVIIVVNYFLERA
ncbi:hypothetical protein LguiB_013282 [Lonicera macranthoides]